MDDYVKQFVERINKDEETKKAIVKDFKYFSWLEGFVTKNNGSFSDDQWIYFPEKITNTEKSNVAKLHLLFSALYDFAKAHRIPDEKSRTFSGSSVYVQYNSNIYKIGFLAGQGVFFFCEKIANRKVKNVINFNDVVKENNKCENCK